MHHPTTSEAHVQNSPLLSSVTRPDKVKCNNKGWRNLVRKRNYEGYIVLLGSINRDIVIIQKEFNKQ